MKKTLKILIIITVVIGIIIGGGYIALQQMAGNPDDIMIENVDVKIITDGTYTGEYATTLVSAKVEVIVEDGQITDIIILEHNHGPNHGAYDVAEYIVDKQTLNVDTVSGASMSSKVILKAVENALLQGE